MESVMIEVKNAVSAATGAAKDWYEGQTLEGIALEEVELDELEGNGLTTLGFSVLENFPFNDYFGSLATASPRYERKYKVIRIDADNGNLISMKMRGE